MARRVRLFVEDVDVAEVAVLAIVVEAVANDEGVRDFEAEVVGLDVVDAPGGLVQQGAYLYRQGAHFRKLSGEQLTGGAAVEDVFYYEDVAALDPITEGQGVDYQLAAGGPVIAAYSCSCDNHGLVGMCA